MFDHLSSYRAIVVSGPQRSGTTIAAAAIAYDTGYTLVKEEEFDYYDREAWQRIVNEGENVVVQCPTMSRYLEDVTAYDVLIIFMRRPLADIYASQERIGWGVEWGIQEKKRELDAYGEDDGEPAAVKYRYWESGQQERLENAWELPYEALEAHPLWTPKEQRKDFAPRQTGRFLRIMVAYPGHAMSTIDVAHGYEKALRALGHEVWPFNYNNRLGFYKEAVRRWESLNIDFRPPERAAMILASEMIAIECIDFVPDVVFMIHGGMVDYRAYELLNRLNIPLALYLTESPYLDDLQAEIVRKGHVDVAFTNERNSAERLQEETGVRTVYLPHSYDPDQHHPREVEEEYQSDLFFFGTLFPERQRLLGELLDHDNGHKFLIGGIDPLHPEDADPRLNEELALAYAGTKIAVNHHRTIISGRGDGVEHHIEPGEAYSLGPRAYEIAACGAFQLCDRTRPELFDLFGETVATYDGADQLISQVDYYLEHDAERQEMAAAARKRVAGCTFDSRAAEIVIPELQGVS